MKEKGNIDTPTLYDKIGELFELKTQCMVADLKSNITASADSLKSDLKIDIENSADALKTTLKIPPMRLKRIYVN